MNELESADEIEFEVNDNGVQGRKESQRRRADLGLRHCKLQISLKLKSRFGRVE